MSWTLGRNLIEAEPKNETSDFGKKVKLLVIFEKVK